MIDAPKTTMPNAKSATNRHSSRRNRHPAAFANFVLAAVAAVLASGGVWLMLPLRSDPLGEAYMWGLVLFGVAGSFVLAFVVAGLAWARSWSIRLLLQLGPLVVAAAWWLFARGST